MNERNVRLPAALAVALLVLAPALGSALDTIPYDALPRLGAADAPVRIVEFADFKCPHCARFALEIAPDFKEFVERGEAAFYFMNYPVVGPDSVTAGEAGALIYDRAGNEAFWQFYEKIFQYQLPPSQTWATPEYLATLVVSVAPLLERDAVLRALRDGTYRDVVRRDAQIGESAGVTGTPTLLVNGRRYTDIYNAAGLRSLIQEELAAR